MTDNCIAPGNVPLLCQWELHPVWDGDSQNDHKLVPGSGLIPCEAVLPSSKSTDSNAVLTTSVDICHAAGAAFIDKFQPFFFGNTGLRVFAMMLFSLIVVVVVK